MKSYYSIIKSPMLTEKASMIMSLRKYIFWVERRANKVEIKRAVEKVYNVKVEGVATSIVKGKTKRLRANQPGKTRSWKKAVVTLTKGNEIKIT